MNGFSSDARRSSCLPSKIKIALKKDRGNLWTAFLHPALHIRVDRRGSHRPLPRCSNIFNAALQGSSASP